MAAGQPVTVVFTHELGEMRCDADCNQTAVDTLGRTWAKEVADPVEEDVFTLNGHPVSNFVTPEFFEPFHPEGGAQFDYMRTLTKPFSLAPGGYSIVLNRGMGAWTDIFGSVDKKFRFSKEDRRFHRTEIRRARLKLSNTHANEHYIQASRGRRLPMTHV
jgi:hypothetical protein